MEQFVWYYRRLRAMSLPEMGYRLYNCLQSRFEQFHLFTCYRVPSPILSIASQHLGSSACSIPNKQPYLTAADALLEGRLRIFSHDYRLSGQGLLWNQAPGANIIAPLTFGKTLNYRDAKLVGDVKYLWELNRHLHLVTLAQAYVLSKEQKYLDFLKVLLDSWLRQCPYLQGPNWTSALELGIRLINWAITWQLIGGIEAPIFTGDGGKKFLHEWLTAIYQHAHFIKGYFSRYSSANNHLIGEAAGLFVATVVWPYWQELQPWQTKAHHLLIREAMTQNAPDGVNREQAIAYQQLVLDFLLITLIVGRTKGLEFPDDYWKRIEVMLEYLASVMDVFGNVPMFGDTDDGYVVKLSQEKDFCPYKSLLATGAILFRRSDFKQKAKHLDDKTRWLLGDEAEQIFEQLERENVPLPVWRVFPDGGYYILGKDFETDTEIRCIVDCGPLGYLSIAAHGHADALALTLSIAGRELLIDPGTYTYHPLQKKWRNYFRGTSAHNTVRVDGQDQSVIGGNFLWLYKAQASCDVWEHGAESDRFAGHHDGYRRLDDPIRHYREIAFFKSDLTIVITDILECQAAHVIERFWHFSEHCVVTQHAHDLGVINDGVQIVLKALEDTGELKLFKGEETIPLGWVSRQFEVKRPTVTAVWTNTIQGAATLQTEITILSPRG